MDDTTEQQQLNRLRREAPQPYSEQAGGEEHPWVVTLESGTQVIIYMSTDAAVYIEEHGYDGKIRIAKQNDVVRLIPSFGNPGRGGSEQIDDYNLERETEASTYDPAPYDPGDLPYNQQNDDDTGNWWSGSSLENASTETLIHHINEDLATMSREQLLAFLQQSTGSNYQLFNNQELEDEARDLIYGGQLSRPQLINVLHRLESIRHDINIPNTHVDYDEEGFRL